MRNGLAIAGMAGGIFFLGQAVASASDGQVADANSSVGQDANSTGSGGENANNNSSEAEAKNVDVTEVETNVTGGDGGINEASINTGIIPDQTMQANTLREEGPPPGEHHEDGTTVTLNTGDVTLTQEANGGDVNGSGNVNVADTGGNQTATATSTVDQSATSQGDEHGRNNEHHDGDQNGPASLSPSMGGDEHHGAENTNNNESSAEATNIHKVDVDTNVTGGDGGSNYADINTGIIGNTFFCPEHSKCTFNFTTGDVTVYQSANGGDVNGSGNVNVGDVKQCDCPKPEGASPAVKPAAHAAPASQQAVALSSAQPSGQLAFTGSDVSIPLTVGLLALGAGAALTLAGRRQTAAV